MNWIKQNPLPTFLLVVTLVATGALIFLSLQASTALAEKQTAFSDARSKYDGLISEPIFPSQENLKKIQASHEEYKAKVQALRADLEKNQIPAKEMSPTQFQDKLSAAVREIQAKAAEQRVELPENFFLGFDAYKSSLPVAGAVTELNVVLDSIVETVNKLIDAKVSKLEKLDRVALPVEGGAPGAAPASPAPGGTGNAANRRQQAAGPKVLERSTFNLTVQGEPHRIQEFMNSALKGSQLITPQLVRFENEQLKGPAKAAPAEGAPIQDPSQAPDPNAATPDPNAPATPVAEAPTINFILGEEKVTAGIRFQIIRLPSAPAKS